VTDHVDITEADLVLFVRSGMSSLSEFLTISEEMRATIISAREDLEDEKAARFALYVAGALNGAHDEVAARADPGSAEEAWGLGALNKALSPGGGTRV
jgi:hypothetical protein